MTRDTGLLGEDDASLVLPYALARESKSICGEYSMGINGVLR